jgi:PAS domain S-box-containing protein
VGRVAYLVALTATLSSILLTWCDRGLALDSSLDVSQYVHDSWKVQEGFTWSRINTIAQTPDGYLWIGTDDARSVAAGTGLYRFDGDRNIRWEPPPGQQLPSNLISSLLAARDGTLWIGTSNGLASWKDGKLTHYEGLAKLYIFTMLEDRGGTVWVSGIGTPTGRLCAIQASSIHCYGEDGNLGIGVMGLYEDRKRNLWAAVVNGFWRWRPGPPDFYSMPGAMDGIRAFIEGDDGGLLFTGFGGIKRLMNGKIEPYSVPGNLQQLRIMRMLRDRDGGLWLGTWDGGVVHVHQGRTDAYSNGLTGLDVVALLEDHEGDIWVVTSEGLDRFRDPAFKTRPPPALIEQIKADGKTYDASNGLRLPAHVRDLAIDYTALTLVAPDKIHFRYKLEGQDPNWREVVNDHHVQYSNLPPGDYHFRVTACNSSGVWNEAGASLDFSIAPAYYQTSWFRVSLVASFVGLLWALHQLRIHQVRDQEKKFRDAVETMPALAFVADPKGNRTFMNKGCLEYTGLSPDEASASGWVKTFHPDDLSRITERWRASETTGRPLDYEVRLRRGSDGVYRWFLIRAVPVRDKRGKIVKWCGAATDIEDRKRAEQLQANLAHISRVNAMGELVASIAHELAQPIMASTNNAKASLRWLQHNPPELTRVREGTEKIVEAGTLASNIIDRLRSLYKNAPPKRELLAMNEVIDEMAGMLRSEARGHGISIRTDLSGDLPIAMADRVQLQQVLMNLMLNGIEAMKDTGGVLVVKSQLREGGQIEISVSDTGPGLPVDKAEQIFDAFFTTKPQGSGMGLAICKSIVESQGGRIWANGDSGRGATFHFTLPAAPPETNPPVDAA